MVRILASTKLPAKFLLICGLLLAAGRLQGALIVATDPNPLNKVSSGISATLKLIQLTEELAESKLDNPHIKRAIDLLAQAGDITNFLKTPYDLAIGGQISLVLPAFSNSPVTSFSLAAQGISLVAGTAADLIDAVADPAANIAEGYGSHSANTTLTATGDRKTTSKWLRIISLVADIVVDPPPAPGVSERVGIALTYNGELLIESKFEMVWNSLLSKWELVITDPNHLFSTGMFHETVDPITLQTTFQLNAPVEFQFDRLLAPGTGVQVDEYLTVAGTLTPEPGTLVAVGSGLLGIAALLLRRATH